MDARGEVRIAYVEGERFADYTRQALINCPWPTITVEACSRFLGIGRAAAYEAVRNGEIPSLRLGRKLLVPVGALLRLLGEGE